MRSARAEVGALKHDLPASIDFSPGIYGPNYEERRKRRIKENYGIDVPEPFFKKE